MTQRKAATDASQVVDSARDLTEEATAKIRRTADLQIRLDLAERLREQVGEPAINVRFLVIADEYVRVGYNFTRLGESLGLTRQRAQQLVAQARKRGIVIPPKK